MTDSAYNQALRYLGPRFLSADELRKKLRRKEYTAAEIEDVICRLTELDYINDERLAEQVLKIWMQKERYGRQYIVQKLKMRGLNTPASLGLYDEYAAAAKAVESLRFTNQNGALAESDAPLTREIKKLQSDKVARFLKNRGFGGDTIRNICAGLFA